MLIHLSPRLYVEDFHTADCALVDLRIDSFGLFLKGGQDIVARKPYPNKRYLVACRKIGQKAIDGILINAPRSIREFSAVTRWAIDAETIIAHRVKYVILDDQFDATTESMVLWYGTGSNLGGWSSRWPEVYKDAIAVNAQPRMDILPSKEKRTRIADTLDLLDPEGRIMERNETFFLPTVEQDRLFGKWALRDRLPSKDSAFHVSGDTRG